MKKIKQSLSGLLIAALSVLFLLWSGLFIQRSSFITIDKQRSFSLFDDAMISMRYAWNFSHGNGLVWNPGEYVQGYTNLLMVLIMSLITLVLSKTMSVLAVQVLGSLLVLFVAYLNARVAVLIFLDGERERNRTFFILTFMCGFLYYPLVYWSLMGMETGLLSVLLIASVYFAFHYSRSLRNSSLYLFSLAGGAAFLTRNDSIIFFVILCAYIYMDSVIERNYKRLLHSFLATTGVYFVIVAGQLFFQHWYYGEWLPNTYTLKMTGMPLYFRLASGFGFITPFISETGSVLLLGLISLLIGPSREKLTLLSLQFAAIFYQIYVGGDPWPYWRMMAPVMPLTLCMAVEVISRVVSIAHAPTWLPRRFFDNAVVVSLVLFCILIVNSRFLQEMSLQKKPYQVDSNRNNVNTAIALNDILDENATVGVFWAGSIPYYVDAPAIDFLGKSDRYIAQLPPDLSGSVSWSEMYSVPGHNKYDLDYSISTLRPTYVQGFAWGNQNAYSVLGDYYIEVEYRNLSLYLLKDSSNVNWERLKIP